jgi:hypothetical protein
MPPPVACPHCGEELDIPPDLRGREVRCAVCRTVFVPTADRPAAPPPTATRNRYDHDRDAPPDDAGRDRWEERPRRRRRGGSLLWVWLVVGTVLGGSCLCCGGLGALVVVMENPSLQGFDSAEGRFHAEFPTTPPTVTQERKDGVTYHVIESRREFPEETYFVHYWNLDAPPIGDAAIRKALDDAAAHFLSLHPGGTKISQSSATQDGYPASDLYLSHPDGTNTAVRFVLDGRRVYAVGITGSSLPPNSQRLEHFRQAFKINPPAIPLGKKRPPRKAK